MTEETMAAALVIAAAAVAIGGAGIAFTYRRCCKERRTKKKIKVKDDVTASLVSEGDPHRLEARREEEDRTNLLGEPSSSKSPQKTARSTISKPGKRSVEEIKARYGRAARQDVTETAAIASEAANKLLERGEKLQRLNDKTADMQAGAEDFASLAEELAKRMEKKRLF